jgi:hypothetical protein
MKNTRYGHSVEIVPRRVSGYSKNTQGFRNADFISMTQPYAAGSLMSTVDDLAIWGRALRSEALLGKPSQDRMLTSYKLKSGLSVHYGYGMKVGDLEGERVLSHGGDINGFSSNITLVPGRRLLFVLLSNNPASEPRPNDTALRIVAKALGKPVEERKTVQLDTAVMDEYAGVYRFDPKTTRAITREGNKLFARRGGSPKLEISALAKDELVYTDGTRLHIRRDAQGKVAGVSFDPIFGPEENGTKTGEPLPQERRAVKIDPAIYDAYAGEYELKPDFSIAITREGEQIFATPTGKPKAELFPESETRFFLKAVDAEIEFVRGADGKVTGLVLHQNGRSIPGKRK